MLAILPVVVVAVATAVALQTTAVAVVLLASAFDVLLFVWLYTFICLAAIVFWLINWSINKRHYFSSLRLAFIASCVSTSEDN
jgi:hypothetical protein